MTTPSYTEYPPKADLRNVSKPLPKVPPGTVNPASMDSSVIMACAKSAVDTFNTALSSNDIEKLSGCFYEQTYWRDIVALTSHLRTIYSPRIVASALLETINLRGLEGKFEMADDPNFAVMGPFMMFIDCGVSFTTTSPALRCAGKMVLLPVNVAGAVVWKIWVLSTWVEDLIQYPENKKLLSLPAKDLSEGVVITTDVLVIGAGTSGLMTAAQLKAYGIESVVLDHNANIGDNWAKRYDSLKFHVPTSNCEMPYIRYPEKLQSPYRLSKDDVAEHLQQYAKNLHLNVITSATIQTTVFTVTEKVWTVHIEIVGRKEVKTIRSKHMVQATGLGSGKPHLPSIKDKGLYKGLRIHSAEYRNTQQLKERGVKTVAIIGSANTAFDVMRDCWEAGLSTTMIVRSPTYIFPYDYVMDPHGIGAYDKLPLEAADRLLNTFPSMLDGQFSHGLFAHLASQEPERYRGLSEAGFPVLDSRDPSVNVLHHLFERGGGHYIDVGGTDLIAEGKVHVRGMVEPVAYTETGLRLSDNSLLEADAIVWCTGFADKNVRETARELLGRVKEISGQEDLLGPEEISARLDATWGVDAEGEVRGVWKRHLQMENFWVVGGTIQHQRWWSRPMVQQIKLALEGVLPPAYRHTPS
ncbi:FAD/NAD(P)-binding domain-containing protein [Periconia macrospinosa]|uniref:FAD/NAD(P)-binding domain-containing protein n=1 Tax=Periconia macrospinosa TaxID=97972 RepID=A0A2V1D6D8_9PLEO|nr:FAD/NAD(P)-binding domain-containing protein [Periconia macrospinosa]